MIVYGKDMSGKLPRRAAKRTKPKYGDNFHVRQLGVVAFRSDKGKPKGKSLVDKFLKNSPVVDPVRQIPSRTKERNEVLQLLDKLAALAKDTD
jgi:hypothetical protein